MQYVSALRTNDKSLMEGINNRTRNFNYNVEKYESKI
jgi:hypothetical protein